VLLGVLGGIFNERFLKKNVNKIKTLKRKKNVYYIYGDRYGPVCPSVCHIVI